MHELARTVDAWVLRRQRRRAWQAQRDWLNTQPVAEDVESGLRAVARQKLLQAMDRQVLQTTGQTIAIEIRSRVGPLLQQQQLNPN